MMRKGLYTVLIVCLLVVAPASVALAQRPEPPDGFEEAIGPPLLDPSVLPLDMPGASEVVQKAVELRESLSPQQLAAAQRILDQYAPDMQAMADVGGMVFGAPTAAEPERIDADVVADMEALISAVDAELAAILDADQLALHEAAMVGPNEPLPGAAASSAWGVAPAETDGYTSNCYYSPIYGAYAKYYAYYGYQYAYYTYVYYCGTSDCYDAYYWAYYGYWYARYALEMSGPSYFGAYYTGMVSVYDGSSSIYWAYYYSLYSYVYNYYSYLDAYDCYYYCGATYAYYSYYYNYYSYQYAYNAYAYAYYCYGYW